MKYLQPRLQKLLNIAFFGATSLPLQEPNRNLNQGVGIGAKIIPVMT